MNEASKRQTDEHEMLAMCTIYNQTSSHRVCESLLCVIRSIVPSLRTEIRSGANKQF